jgi:hypothetical protein
VTRLGSFSEEDRLLFISHVVGSELLGTLHQLTDGLALQAVGC